MFSQLKLVLLRYDLFVKYLHPQTVRQHCSTELAAIFVGKFIRLLAVM